MEAAVNAMKAEMKQVTLEKLMDELKCLMKEAGTGEDDGDLQYQ